MIIDQIYALNPNFSDATHTMDSWNSVNIKTTEAAKSLNLFKEFLRDLFYITELTKSK